MSGYKTCNTRKLDVSLKMQDGSLLCAKPFSGNIVAQVKMHDVCVSSQRPHVCMLSVQPAVHPETCTTSPQMETTMVNMRCVVSLLSHAALCVQKQNETNNLCIISKMCNSQQLLQGCITVSCTRTLDKCRLDSAQFKTSWSFRHTKCLNLCSTNFKPRYEHENQTNQKQINFFIH